MSDLDYPKMLENLTSKIKNRQKILQVKNRQHPLLSLVNIDEIGLHYTEEFSLKYTGKTLQQGLEQYSKDLSSAILEE
jgi:hypothetical protein